MIICFLRSGHGKFLLSPKFDPSSFSMVSYSSTSVIVWLTLDLVGSAFNKGVVELVSQLFLVPLLKTVLLRACGFI